jgi:apolipoprotein N-acyltransferase
MQQIPVPVGMWNPIQHSSVPLGMFGPSSVTVRSRRAAILVCYEQFLTWPLLKAFLHRPDLLIGVANDYWVRETRLPESQCRILSFWARLFHSSVISATND